MGSKTLFYQVDSDKPFEDVKSAIQKSFMFLGGTMQNRGDGFHLLEAKNGINFAFAAEFETFVNVKESKTGKYDVMVNINWKPNGLFWVCLIVGFFIFGILWIIPFLYLFIDPSSAYQQSLFNIQNFLNM